MWSWHLRLGGPPNWVGCMMECSMAAVSTPRLACVEFIL